MPAFTAILGKGQGVMGEGFLLRFGVGHRRLPGEMGSLWRPSPTIIFTVPFIKAACQPLSQAL